MAADRRFIEMKKVTGSTEEPMTFHIRTDSRNIISQPIGKEVCLVKGSFSLDVPLVITPENQNEYIMIVGEQNLNNRRDGAPKFIRERNRFTSILNYPLTFRDGVPNDVDNISGCHTQYCKLPVGSYSSIEDIVKHLKVNQRTKEPLDAPLPFCELSYNKKDKKIDYYFASGKYTDRFKANDRQYPVPEEQNSSPLHDTYPDYLLYPYRELMYDTIFVSKKLAAILDSDGVVFSSWSPGPRDKIIIAEGDKKYGIRGGGVTYTDYTTGHQNRFDFVENYPLVPGAWLTAVELDVTDFLRLNMEEFIQIDTDKPGDRLVDLSDDQVVDNADAQADQVYDHWLGPNFEKILKPYHIKDEGPLINYPPYVTGFTPGYILDRRHFAYYHKFSTDFSRFSTNIRSVKLKTRGLNQEQTTTSLTGTPGYVDEFILANLTVTSSYNVGEILEFIPQLDLQSYALVGTTNVREFYVDVFLETTSNQIIPATQAKNSISSILLKVTDIAK